MWITPDTCCYIQVTLEVHQMKCKSTLAFQSFIKLDTTHIKLYCFSQPVQDRNVLEIKNSITKLSRQLGELFLWIGEETQHRCALGLRWTLLVNNTCRLVSISTITCTTWSSNGLLQHDRLCWFCCLICIFRVACPFRMQILLLYMLTTKDDDRRSLIIN